MLFMRTTDVAGQGLQAETSLVFWFGYKLRSSYDKFSIALSWFGSRGLFSTGLTGCFGLFARVVMAIDIAAGSIRGHNTRRGFLGEHSCFLYIIKEMVKVKGPK